MLDVPLVNYMPMEDAIVQRELSLMELNALSEQLIDVSEFQTLTGTELTVYVSQDSQPTEILASVMALSSETIVKDALLNQIQYGATEYADATTDLLMSMVSAHMLRL